MSSPRSFGCEEGDISDWSNAEYVWVIDPIDGTINYARGISEYCISVALMYRREVIMGVVYNPIKDELFYATKGKGAYLSPKIQFNQLARNEVLVP